MGKTMTVWGAIVLCALVVSCSRGGKSGAVTASRSEALVEGTSVGALRIDEATVEDAASAFGVSAAEARAVGSRGVVEMRTPRFQLSFVPPADGQGPPRLYAARVPLREDVYTGKTSRGIGFLDSADAMLEAYGPPDGEWIHMSGERLHYYQQGVILTTQHPKLIPPAVYAKARTALGKEPSEGPTSHVVVAIMVVRPFTVRRAGRRSTAGQQVVSSAPETDLLVSAF